MAMTFTETLGFIQTLSQYLTANQAGLLAKGLTVGPWIAELETLKQELLVKDGEQEALKTQLKNKTAEVTAAEDAVYRIGSTRLDTIIALVGKTTEEGKQVARIRSDIRRGANAPAATPPTP